VTQYGVLRYYYISKTAQALILHMSIHKLTWTKSQFNSYVMANALNVGLENMP